MSFDESVKTISIPANTDLSTKQYFGIEIANSSGVGQAALAGNGEDVVGVLYNKPSAADRPATVAISGVVKASAGGTITAGDDVGLDAAGEFVSAATGDVIVGVALASAVDGDIFPLLLQPRGAAFA